MISRYFIERPIFAWVIAIVIMLCGMMAILFLGEQPHLYHGIGIALIAAGIVLATRRRT